MRRIVFVALLGVLTGCGGTRLSHELKPYVGRDMHELVTHLGKPTGQRETTGDRVYVWSSDSNGVLATTPFAENAGTGGGLSYAGSSTRGGIMPVQYACTIEVTVNALNIVQSYEFEGSDAGCSHYRRLLSH